MDGKELGTCVASLRKMRGLSREELAKFSGVCLNSIKKIEHGGYNITVNTLAAIAKTLGVSASDLLRSAEK